MERILNRTRKLLLLEKGSLLRKWRHEHSLGVIEATTKHLSLFKINAAIYMDNEPAQQRIFVDRTWLTPLQYCDNEGMALDGYLQLLDEMENVGINRMAIPVAQLISTEVEFENNSLEYLMQFSRLPLYGNEARNVNRCMRAYSENSMFKGLSDLQEHERRLFTKDYMLSRLIPAGSFAASVPIIAGSAGLQRILEFLHACDATDPLSVDQLTCLAKHADGIMKNLDRLHALLAPDIDMANEIIAMWLGEGCMHSELSTIVGKLERNTGSIKDKFQNRASYIAFIYGETYTKTAAEIGVGYREGIIIYSIRHKKKAFLRMILDNANEFTDLSSESILFRPAFYKDYCNINALNIKDIHALSKMPAQDWDIGSLPVRQYTFNEIKALYGLPGIYATVYDALAIDNVDKRLQILRQLAKKELLTHTKIDVSGAQAMAARLVIKPFYEWMKEDFGHIENISYSDAVQLLAQKEETVFRFLPDISNCTELRFIMRNLDTASGYNTFSAFLNELLDFDAHWLQLQEHLELDDAFIQANLPRIQDFVMREGAYLAATYFTALSSAQKEGFKRIVRAILLGKFSTLKYFHDDLTRELDYPINETIKAAWMHSKQITSGALTVYETDDFFDVMRIGEQPSHTCMNYSNGAHRECLLSIFDSNKKVIYIKDGESVVGRAIIRLTKGHFAHNTVGMDDEDTETSMKFADVESVTEEQMVEINKNEHLTLFLERMYDAHMSPETKAHAVSMLYKLVAEKARELGALLVTSSNYCRMENLISTKYYIYISKSKAGAQYFDSYGQKAYMSDEGSYVEETFLMQLADSECAAA